MLPYPVRVAIWIIVYLLFILGPLFALLAGALPPARDFWTEFSVVLGYAGLAMMSLQFGLTARFRYVTIRGARMSSITFTARSR
jgi:predicted ferric reductase